MSLPSPREFYEQFKNDPEGARGRAFQLGREMGQILSRRLGVQGDSLETVAAVLNEFQRQVQGETSAKVEGNKVTMRVTGFCAIMRASMTLNIPWEWLDTNFAWPLLEGIVSLIRPDIKLRMQSAKCRGDPACIHIFETQRG